MISPSPSDEHEEVFCKKLTRNGYSGAEKDFLMRVGSDFPDLKLTVGRKFAFRPPITVVVGPREEAFLLLFLHELGHALLGHVNFRTDAERLKMEVAAWEKARELSTRYGVQFSEETMQNELDTYRDWLHQKSRCPGCGLTRFETPDGRYHCPRCENFILSA